MARADRYSEARHLLETVLDPRAAPALRRALGEVSDPLVLSAVVRALGGCGEAEDEAALLPFAGHPDIDVRAAVRASLTELDAPTAAQTVAEQLQQARRTSPEEGGFDEHRHVLDCLAWLRDPRCLPGLRDLARAGTLDQAPSCRFSVTQALIRLGQAEDLDLVTQATELAIREADDELRGPWQRRALWRAFSAAIESDAPQYIDQLWASLQDLPEQVLAGLRPLARDASPLDLSLQRTVPRWSFKRASAAAITPGAPFAKFAGQPAWREAPTWPIGGDGRLLLFFGQVPLPDGRTAFIFLGGPHEWEPLGQGNAVVVQPGSGLCQLPTRPVARAPQIYGWRIDEGRYRRRQIPQPASEEYFVLQPGLDPSDWTPPDLEPSHDVDDEGDWNKVGGTPRWLQGEESPTGAGWEFAFQFSASTVGFERADGAECYGWIHPTGTAAFAWQCH